MRSVHLGGQFIVAVKTRQAAMEQCSRATARLGKRFIVVAELPKVGWIVQRVKPLTEPYRPPGAKRR